MSEHSNDTPPLRAIQSRDDVVVLVDAFYSKVRADDVIGYIFDEVADVDWDTHLPIMYDFWETLLLSARSYGGGAMQKHIELARRTPLRPEHFQRWLSLFEASVTDLYAGDVAASAIHLGRNIARSIQMRAGTAERTTNPPG